MPRSRQKTEANPGKVRNLINLVRIAAQQRTNMKTKQNITTESPVKADAAVTPKQAPVVSLYNQVLGFITPATLAPKVRLDGCIAFARAIGAPDTFSLYRDEILSAVGRLTGTAKRSANGSKGTVSLNLIAAMKSVVEHSKDASPEAGEEASEALASLRRVLAIENAFDGGRKADFAIAGE